MGGLSALASRGSGPDDIETAGTPNIGYAELNNI